MKFSESGRDEDPVEIAGGLVKTDLSPPLFYKCDENSEWRTAVCDSGHWEPPISASCMGE